MSFEDVLKRGDDFLDQYPRTSKLWNIASHSTCLFVILQSKLFLNLLYKPRLHHIEKLDEAYQKARDENRCLLTVMNHMSVVDDPAFFAALPMRFHMDVDNIRWGLGAANICFSNKALSWFFNLGKILGTDRFGVGPFQGSIDAAIRILSPDDTLDLEYTPGVQEAAKPLILQEVNNLKPTVSKELVNFAKPGPETTNVLMSKSPFIRNKTSWFHVFPEGFVLQLEEPHNNSMRYFRWGISRLILECTRAPVVVPIYTYGFEKVAPEDTAGKGIQRWLPANVGAEIHIHIGSQVSDKLIEDYRQKWRQLCKKYIDPENPKDLTPELKTGSEAQHLRSDLAADLRDAVLGIRNSIGFFKPEDPRFKSPKFWKEFTKTEGLSDPDVKFIGENWAIKRLQKHLPEGVRED
ncbi:uncharacterized protein PRCAT00005914001 [Priceomyces carsonii]|uniref:uncharacterized protein n=1 Tax=Priceomyces carsonii TaxID=28549 RepID=UPI002EDB92A9|nr:unnamed protein product [Priceomyces carsonii]